MVTAYLEESRLSLRPSVCEDSSDDSTRGRSRVTVEEVADEDAAPSVASSGDVSDEDANEDSDGGASSHQSQEEPPLSRPSEYLRQRCPLCFGGKNCHDPSVVWVLCPCYIESVLMWFPLGRMLSHV